MPDLEEPEVIPPGRWVELEGRGRTFIRELPRAGAPVVVLLHGWIATSGVNWLSVFHPLAERFHVVGVDHRGHGRGIRARGRFRLEDCADDVAAALDALGIDRAILVGYSMGGPIAQLTWRRHRPRVHGLVLCSTATRFVYQERVSLLVSAAVPALLQVTRVTDVVGRLPIRRLGVAPPGLVATRSRALGAWAATELRRHDLRSIAEAGVSLSTYDASSWIGDVDVPTSVVITTRDRTVDVTRQLRMARAIRGATVHYIADGHLTCAGRTVFAPAVVAACDDVAARLDPAAAG